MAWIERRRRQWWAFHDVPADAQAALGTARLRRGLETEVKAEALRRLPVVEAQWRADIERARSPVRDPVEADARFWRKAVQGAKSEMERGAILDMVADVARDRRDAALRRVGILDERASGEVPPEAAEADRFFALATGKVVGTLEHLEEWLATLQVEDKTRAMRRSAITGFAETFPHVHLVTRKEVQRWSSGQVTGANGRHPTTIRRMLSDLRTYWRYLAALGVAPEDAAPFDHIELPKGRKKADAEDTRKPFEPADVVRLVQAAEARGDQQLADLIRLAMFTGARLESLCALKVGDVAGTSLVIRRDKTAAGARTIPLHPELVPVVKRLAKGAGKDGYLLPDLEETKYGDRSGAIGKRFGRLKTSLGFGADLVFHSIRKTVATLFKHAGVPEATAADLLGHRIPTMTYGLYAAGASEADKRAAIEKLVYPAPAGRGRSKRART